MSEQNNGGPAFPQNGSVRFGDVDHLGTTGMSLRDYFIAHAPSKPQPWFQPVMSQPRPEKPVMPQAGDSHELRYVREFELVIDADEVKDPDLRAYVLAVQAYRPLASAWDSEFDKQCYIQWPAAWADAMLKARAA